MFVIELSVIAALVLQSVPPPTQSVPPDELNVEENDEPVFPKAFRGYWASSLKACEDATAINGVRIARTRIYGYESDSSLLIVTPVNHHDTPAGEDALTVTALVAERGELDVGTGKIRLSRVGDKLHMSRATIVSENENFKPSFGNVRCPG